MGIFRRKKKETSPKGQRSVYITDRFASAVFQEILKDNNIPFVCRQPGAGGYLKHITGGFLTTDEILVNEADFEQTQSLYRAYFEADTDI